MGTGSGGKQVTINSLERAVSTDQNRLQAFGSAGMAEVLRYLFDIQTSEAEAGGMEAVGTSVGNPLRGVVLSGIRARPEIGTTNMFVEAGVGIFVNPTGDTADDSPLKWIKTGGESTAGVLTLTAGAVADRVDMLECRLRTAVQETTSRDIYDPATGLFTATLVPKVEEFILEFQIRTGTPGGEWAGLGTQSEWMPLCVWVTPVAATTFDDVDYMWDVRRLASDLAGGGTMGVSQVVPSTGSGDDGPKFASLLGGNLSGHVRVNLNGLKCGGEIGRVEFEDGVVTGTMDIVGGTHDDLGYTPVSDGVSYLYSAFPFDLPRWCRYYTAAHGSRTPGPFRGLVVRTHHACDGLGQPLGVIAMPTAYGLGGTFGPGLEGGAQLIMIQYQALTTPVDTVMTNDGWCVSTNTIVQTASAGGATTTAEWSGVFLDDVNIPRVATHVRMYITRNQGGAAGAVVGQSSVGLENPYLLGFNWYSQNYTTVTDAGILWQGVHEWPLRPPQPWFQTPDPSTVGRGDFFFSLSATGITQTNASAAIRGLKLFL